MLTLTRKTGYALIALVHMARGPEECFSAREISGRYHVPLPLLMNVLKQLTQRGLAQSVRGPRGGYRLAIPPEQVRLSDIIEAVEGPIHLTRCSPKRDAKGSGGKRSRKACELTASCPVRSSIHRVHNRLIEFLDEVTLADIAHKAPARADESVESQTSEAAGVQGT